MINYMDAFLNIQKVKKQIKTMTFEDAKDFCVGFNCDGTLFDFNYGNITGTIFNEDDKPVLSGTSCYDVYDSEYPEIQYAFHGTEAEIYQKSREILISQLRDFILGTYHPTNAKEFEILGRALCGCNGITILDDGGIMNGYGYTRGRKYSNADWRANELIDDAIKNLKK